MSSETLAPKRNTLRCRKCKQEKHRKFFIPKSSTAKRYDHLCSACRDYDKHYLTPSALEKRQREGLMTQEQVDRILARRRENLRRNYVAILKEGREKARTSSWNRPIYITTRMREWVRNRPEPTPEIAAWKLKAMALINETLDEMRERRKNEKYLEEGTAFWYDIVFGTRAKLKALIDEYPEGADKCPLGML